VRMSLLEPLRFPGSAREPCPNPGLANG